MELNSDMDIEHGKSLHQPISTVESPIQDAVYNA